MTWRPEPSEEELDQPVLNPADCLATARYAAILLSQLEGLSPDGYIIVYRTHLQALLNYYTATSIRYARSKAPTIPPSDNGTD